MTDSSAAGDKFRPLLRKRGADRFMGARCLLSLWVGVLAMVPAATAWAEPSAEERETARSLMHDGRGLRDDGDLVQALTRFQAANEIMHVPTTALEVAHTQVALGLLCEARNTLAEMRRIPPNSDDPLPFQEARAAAKALDAALAERIPSLIIVSSDAGGKPVSIWIDGTPVPPALVNLPRKVNPGRHVVLAKMGVIESRQQIDVRDGENKTVRIVLRTNPVGSGARGDGASNVRSSAPAPSSQPDPVDAGRIDDAVAEPLPSEMPASSEWTWAYIGIGAGSVAVITGAIAGGMSLSLMSSLHSECPNHLCGPGQPSDDLDKAKTLATVSTFSFVAAGVAGAAVLGGILLGGKKAPMPTRLEAHGIVPWVGVGSAGVRGVF